MKPEATKKHYFGHPRREKKPDDLTAPLSSDCLAQKAATGQLQTGRVDMQGGAASICGEAGCHFGVHAEHSGFKTFIAGNVNEIFSLALACKSLLLHVTWARETASSACFWIAIDNLGRNVPLLP